MTILKENWADAITPGVYAWFERGVRQVSDIGSMVYTVQNSSRADEDVVNYDGMDPDAWESYKKTGKIAEVSVIQGQKTNFEHVTYPVYLPIERELIEDDLYNVVQRKVTQLAKGAAKKRQRDMASVFNNAFSTSFPVADGNALCSDSHDGADNNFALALTKDNVSTVREAMIDFTDAKGNRLEIIPDMLIVPTGLGDEGIEIAASLQDPSSANNARNPHNVRGLRVIEWPYLTDSNAWFMVDSLEMSTSLHWFDRVPLSIQLEASKTDGTRAVYLARMRYSFGASDFTWIAGSNPS